MHPGIRFSDILLKDFNKFKADFKAGKIRVPGQRFEQLLQRKVRNDILRDTTKYKNNAMIQPNKTYTPTPLLNVLQVSNALLEEDPNIIAQASEIQKKLLEIQSNGLYTSQPSEEHTQVLCLDTLSKKEIELLYSILGNEECSSTPDMRRHLEVLIPKTTIPRMTTATDTQGKKCANCDRQLFIGMLFRKKRYMSNACYYCHKPFCPNCQPEPRCYSRLGLTKKHPFCTECKNMLANLDTDDWMRVCLQHLEQGTIGSTKTALGCLAMALLSSEDKFKPILEVAQGLLHNGLPELALPLLASIIKERTVFKTLVHKHVLTASVLVSLAERHDAQWEDRLELLQAAKEVCQIAEIHVAKSMEVPKLAAVTSSTNKALESLLKEKPLNNDIFQKLSALWSIREYEKLLSFVIPKIFSDEKAIKSKTIEAIKHFMMIISFDAFIDKMRPDDQAALFLLNGIVKFGEGNSLDALVEVEKAAWAGNRDLYKALVDVIIHFMAKFPFLSTKEFFDMSASTNLFKVCSLATDNRSRCLNLIFPSVHEMQFPVSAKWPHIELIGLNVRGHRKFENAVNSQVRDGNWSEWDAALAYIDYIAACNHPTQFPLCFIYASIWIYKYIQANPSLPDNVKYALTKTVVICLYQANGMAILRLAPSMKLYVSRFSFSILIHILQLTKSVAGEGAIELAALLLRTILHTCRFCPLWDMPLVSLSETALLSIKANRYHSSFLLNLQQVRPDQRPITEAELHYQLYENDICRVHPLQDPETARSRAMEELLSEKQWSWNNVNKLMTSPLSPRDSEGWLVRGHTLGKNMEYAQLKGFRFNVDSNNPSVELLVVPANEREGRIGLFSQDDVNTVLQMSPDDFHPAFFSLDPPSETEHYHPFQQFRYKPDSFQKTDFLHTMFETDYLMKSFSVGSEVSAKPPFKQRPCKQGLLKGLPLRLAEALKPVHERPGGHQGNVHRFWIQADKITYSPESDGTKITLHLGEVKMTIRSHPLFPGSDGKLEDTEHGNDPDSAEAQFAADMTSAYDEISLHFPMFARLRELAKLQFLGLFLKNIIQSSKEKSENVTVPYEIVTKIQEDAKKSHTEQVDKILTDMERNIGVWPSAEDYNAVSAACDKVQASMHQYVPRSALEPEVKRVLAQNDESLVTELVNVFSQLTKHNVSRSTLNSQVRAWLREKNSRYNYSRQARSNLASLIVSQIPLPTREDLTRILKEQFSKEYTTFNQHVNSLKPTPNKIDPNACDWVPAALYQEETDNYYSLCYGGVLLCPELKTGYVYPLPRSTQAVRLGRPRSFNNARPSRSYHTDAYRAPHVLAKSAILTFQPKANTDGATGGGDSGTGGGSSGTGSSDAAGGGASGHPGVAAGGRGGGRGGGGEPPDDSSSEEEDEDEGESDDEEGSGYQRISTTTIQMVGKRGLHQLARIISDGNPTQFKLADITLSSAQVLIENRLIDNIKATNVGRERLIEAHINSLRERPLKFEQYFANQVDTIKSLKDSKEQFKIPKGPDLQDIMITKKTRNVIYCICCKSTGSMYVGRTKRSIHTRMREHQYQIRNPDKTKKKHTKLVSHFNKNGISLEDFKVIVLEKISDGTSKEDIRRIEQEWMTKLDTREHEKGLNCIRAVAKEK